MTQKETSDRGVDMREESVQEELIRLWNEQRAGNDRVTEIPIDATKSEKSVGIIGDLGAGNVDLHTAPAKRTDGRDERGRLLPGHRATPSAGRRKKSEDADYIRAIDNALPAYVLQRALADALEWAYEKQSPKQVLEIAKFVFSYKLGKPVQRSVSARMKLEDLLGMVTNVDEDVIEVAAEHLYQGDSNK